MRIPRGHAFYWAECGSVDPFNYTGPRAALGPWELGAGKVGAGAPSRAPGSHAVHASLQPNDRSEDLGARGARSSRVKDTRVRGG